MDYKNINLSKFFIRNCDFKLQCTQDWENLHKKDGDNTVRYCSECKKDVHFVKDAWDLIVAVEKNYCVAVPRTLVINAKAVINRKKPLVGHVMLPK